MFRIKRISQIAGFLLIVFLGFVFFTRLLSKEKSFNIISPLASSFASAVETVKGITTSRGLEETVTKSLEGTKGTYSVVVKNLKTGEEYNFNEHKVYDSASLYKLWVMAVVREQIKTGKLSEDQVITHDIEELNKRFDIASESAELTEGTFKMPIKNALSQMITISHNYAALSLVSEVKTSSIKKFLESYGLSESTIQSPPRTTAHDVALYYEKLYKRELIDAENSQIMIELLKKQQLNDRIPLHLPDEVDVAHKTGELGGVKHDAGIVFTEFGDYIIVMMSESGSPKGAAEREAELSKNVYEYFERKR